MKIGYLLALATLASGLASTPAAAWDQDPFAQYLQRSDTITSSAGDAKATNSVTHIIDPWPPYVGNRRIPGNGQRLSGAVERYRDVSKLPNAPKPIVPLFDTSGSTSNGGQSQGQGQ